MCSLQSGEWYRFDDEEVSRLDKKYLGEEEDEAMLGEDSASIGSCCVYLLSVYGVGLSSKKKPKCPKGYRASANAYLLVYTRDDGEESINKGNILK